KVLTPAQANIRKFLRDAQDDGFAQDDEPPKPQTSPPFLVNPRRSAKTLKFRLGLTETYCRRRRHYSRDSRVRHANTKIIKRITMVGVDRDDHLGVFGKQLRGF